MHVRRLAIALMLALLRAPGVAAGDSDIVVIVHPDRHMALSIDDVAQIYLRRHRVWDDGNAIVPLNLASGHELRTRFSRAVLRQGDRRLADYWNRQYFLGVLPPATLASTEAMRRYVASDPNAIGYLPASEVDSSVRVVLHLP